MCSDVNNIQKKIFSGIFWQGSSDFLSRGIQFVISILLARLVAPSEFGIIALILAVTSFFGAFVDGGFSNALIQKKDADDLDCDSVFWFNLIAALVIYIVIFFCAPAIAEFYRQPIVCILLRVTGLKLILASLVCVQDAVLSRKMLFRSRFKINFYVLLCSGVLGVIAAWAGLEVWALSIQLLVHSFLSAVLYWLYIGYRPKVQFSFSRLRIMFRFSCPLFLASFLDVIYRNFLSIIIGKKYNVDRLAYYNRGNSYPQLVCDTLNNVALAILFPAFSALQDHPEEIIKLSGKLLRIWGGGLIPVLGILAIGGTPIITLVLGPQWVSCVIFMQIAVIGQIFRPFDVLDRQIFKACGRSDLILKVEFIKKFVSMGLLLLSIPFGVLGMAWSVVASHIANFIINAAYCYRLIHWSIARQFVQICRGGIFAIVILGGAYLLSNLVSNQYLQLLVLIAVTSFCYALLAVFWLRKKKLFRKLPFAQWCYSVIEEL